MIIVRAIIFYRDNNEARWRVIGREFKHTYEQVCNIDSLFTSNSGYLLNNLRNLYGSEKKKAKILEKKKFLSKIQVNGFYELLQKYSVNEIINSSFMPILDEESFMPQEEPGNVDVVEDSDETNVDILRKKRKCTE